MKPCMECGKPADHLLEQCRGCHFPLCPNCADRYGYCPGCKAHAPCGVLKPDGTPCKAPKGAMLHDPFWHQRALHGPYHDYLSEAEIA